MVPNWQDFLVAQGARIENGELLDFGDSTGERRATQSATVMADLSGLDVLLFAGEEAESFLQGQLSCDVREARQDHATLGSYCTPKGRMLATFLLWRDAHGFRLQLPTELRAAIQKRLSMYILRAKVKASDASADSIRLGVAGTAADAALVSLGLTVPPRDYDISEGEGVRVIRLPGGRFELVVSPGRAEAVWTGLRATAQPVGPGCWQWLAIQAGIPEITLKTQEQFVPQMVNLEVIGGVSFTKGCYPGQEIVARSQYLGKVKRRMFLAHVGGSATPAAGDELFGAAPAGQSPGMIVNAQAAPEGGYDVLAVILSTALEGGRVRWGSENGPELTLRELPYTPDA